MSKQDSFEAIDLAAVRTQAVKDLADLLARKRRALHRARYVHNAGQRGKTHLLGQMRKDIARVATVLSEKQAGERRYAAQAAEESNRA